MGKEPHTIWSLVKLCNQADSKKYPLPEKTDIPDLVASVVRGKPKINALLKVLSVVGKEQRKGCHMAFIPGSTSPHSKASAID